MKESTKILATHISQALKALESSTFWTWRAVAYSL